MSQSMQVWIYACQFIDDPTYQGSALSLPAHQEEDGAKGNDRLIIIKNAEIINIKGKNELQNAINIFWLGICPIIDYFNRIYRIRRCINCHHFY